MNTVAQKHENFVSISGNLARDPELKYTSSGKCVANITVATKIGSTPEYHRCVAWESLAEAIGEKFSKGSFIKIYGRLQTRSWLDPKTDTKRYTTEIVIKDFSDGTTENTPDDVPPFRNNSGGTNAARAILSPAEKRVTDEDIPF